MTSNNPKISVIMSVFNGERFLHASISSILNQTFTNFEFIIINDGSIDNSLEIIQSYANTDSRITIHNKNNSGLADSLNKGIEISTGDWIARIDADDISMPRRLELQYKYALSNPGTAFVGSDMIKINENGDHIKKTNYPRNHKNLLKNLLFVKKFPPHSSAFYSQEKFKNAGGYRTNIRRGQDWDLWLRLSSQGDLACLPEYLTCIRSHGNQITHDNGGKDQIIFSRIAITDYWIKELDKIESPTKNVKDFLIFKTFIVNSLNKSNFFFLQEHIGHLKNHFENKNFIKLISLVILKPIFTLKFIMFLLNGDSLPKKMAQDWSRVNR
jgi:glycosyltransferase involved in cell wall biosynthesis